MYLKKKKALTDGGPDDKLTVKNKVSTDGEKTCIRILFSSLLNLFREEVVLNDAVQSIAYSALRKTSKASPVGCNITENV